MRGPRVANYLGFAFLTVFLTVATASCSSPPARKTYSPYSEGQPAPHAQATPVPTMAPLPPGASGPPDQQIKNAQAFYQANKIDEARAVLWSMTEDQVPPPMRAEYWNLRGLTELAKRQPEAAQVSFQKALHQNKVPEYRGYYQYNYATSLYESSRPTDAYDVLVSIDMAPLDTAQQAKVLNLKAKIAARVPPSMGTRPTPSPGLAAVNPATGVAPTPAETYSGPVKAYRIGLLVPLSGKYENFGKKAQRAVELAFRNSSNSSAKNYEIVPVDSGDTSPSQLEGLKKLVEEQQVIAVIGPMLSKGIDELAARAAYYQVPLISIAQVAGPVTSHLFSCSISNRNQAKKVAEYATRYRGYNKFAILAPSNNPGEELANAFWDEIEARKGTIKAFEYYDPDRTDFRDPVDKALGLHYQEPRADELKDLAEKRKQLKITRKTMKTQQYFNLTPIVDFDAVFIADDGRIASQIIPTFTYRDAKNVIFLGTTSWNSNQFLQRTEGQSEGAVFPVAFNTLNPAKTSKAFYDLFLTTYNALPGEFDAVAFDAAALVLKVMNRDPSTREGFRSELESVSSVESATGEISIEDHRCSRNLTLYTVKKGKFESIEE